MWESKGFVMNSSYRTNHRQVKEKQESLGAGVLSDRREGAVEWGKHPRLLG